MAILQKGWHLAKRAAWTVLAVAVLALSSGCVAFDVGKPETVTTWKTEILTDSNPLRCEVLGVEAKAQAEGSRLRAWIEADVREEFQVYHRKDKTSVTKQKRLSIGFFPGAGEIVYPRQGGPREIGMGTYATSFAGLCVFSCGILTGMMTVENLLVEPFLPWGCPGPTDCFEGPGMYNPMIDGDWHYGLAGVHKYLLQTTNGPVFGKRQKEGTKVDRRTRAVNGPYEVSLRIPGAGVEAQARVGELEGSASFELPQVERGGAYEATLEFRSLYTEPWDPVRKSWDRRTLKQSVWLREKPKPAVAHVPPPQADREAVREVHHYHETRVVERLVEPSRPGREFEVEKSVGGAGRTVWRVRILAEHLTVFEADRKVKPQILDILRDEFAERNPDIPRREINAWAAFTTEDGGRTLVYEGAASSLIPSLESLSYSAETRRGTITMRLTGQTDLAKSKRFVRDNITAIVCDKNVALAAGERPPDGAMYRSLDENFSDGVLTVEFEAVE